MKKYLFVGISIAILSACGNDKKNEDKQDTKSKVESRNAEGLTIAYYDQDSVAKYFDYFKEQDSIISKKQLGFQQAVNVKQKAIEDYIRIQEDNMKRGLLSQNDINSVQQNIQSRQEQLYKFQESEGARIENERMQMMEALSNKMKLFSSDFCNENKIDILLIYAPGGQINFITPEMDVTKEFTAYLNQRQNDLISGKKK